MAKSNSKESKLKLKSKKKPVKKVTGLSETSLIAKVSETLTPARIDIVFTSGLGQITSSLFRSGLLINLQSISSSGSIHFSDVQSGDAISINGVCTGNATLTVSVPTNPTTPDNFGAGNINTGYDVL